MISLKVLEGLFKQCCAMGWNFVKDCGKLHYAEVIMPRKRKDVKELEEAVDDLKGQATAEEVRTSL